jgi:hypothetical protein
MLDPPPLKARLSCKRPSYKLRAVLPHCPQQPLPTLVNQSDIVQVDDACSTIVALIGPLPGRSQLSDPRPDQVPLHNESPFCWRFHNSDLQHVLSPLRVKRIGLRPDKRSTMFGAVWGISGTVWSMFRSAGLGLRAARFNR